MLKKILLGVRIALPFILNVLLFLWIYDINKDTEYAITNTLFYVGIISLIYGLAALFITPRSSVLYIQSKKAAVINLALADQHIKNYHDGKESGYTKISITTNHLKLIYIILGALLCIASVIVYSL